LLWPAFCCAAIECLRLIVGQLHYARAIFLPFLLSLYELRT
jgi:hypothetical protein